MTADLKPLVTTAEVRGLLPGKGDGILKRLLSARWLVPCLKAPTSIYRTVDVVSCLNRLGEGEIPQPIHVWKAALGMEGSRTVAHLVLATGSSRAVCGFKGAWISASHAGGQCTRCLGAAKTLRVEAA